MTELVVRRKFFSNNCRNHPDIAGKILQYPDHDVNQFWRSYARKLANRWALLTLEPQNTLFGIAYRCIRQMDIQTAVAPNPKVLDRVREVCQPRHFQSQLIELTANESNDTFGSIVLAPATILPWSAGRCRD